MYMLGLIDLLLEAESVEDLDGIFGDEDHMWFSEPSQNVRYEYGRGDFHVYKLELLKVAFYNLKPALGIYEDCETT